MEKGKIMAEKFSFKDLLTRPIQLVGGGSVKIDKISIPLLQRDYAQGRMFFNEKTGEYKFNLAGEKFIEEIFSTLLSSDDKGLELDFIYGSIDEERPEKDDENKGNTNILSPLDGQQRLTTLFLLYWFIGGAELDEEGKSDLLTSLEKFTYLTRTSSNVFCASLVEELKHSNIDFKGAEDISLQIKNLSWFHDVYTLDPTIVSMLNMLNKIQSLYRERECQNVFGNLERMKFYILPLKNFELTEELYVKMNARGKQLTDFENFKADLQKWLQSLNLPEKEYRKNTTLPYDMYFINKMDNEWLQCLWKAGNGSENRNFDSLFLKFFYDYLLNYHILDYKDNYQKLDKQSDYNALNETRYLGFSIFEKFLKKGSMLDKIEIVLDNISQHYEDILKACQPVWSSGKILFNIFSQDMQLKDRTIFCALVLYLTKYGYDEKGLKKWMRVVWNIAENANIDSVAVVVGVNKLFAELVEYAGDIYANLADETNIITSTQAEEFVAEERLKAGLIMTDPAWEESLIIAEGNSFFRGNISFLLPEEVEAKDIDRGEFEHRYEMAKIFFDEKGICDAYSKNGHLFLRALLSRYDDLGKIKYHIADKDEREHSLKHMLSSDKVVRKAIYEWFSLEDEDKIHSKLVEEVAKNSPIKDVFDRKLHEELYKSTNLINWMQETGAIRYKDDCISKPNSPIYQIYVRGYRNEIIKRLIEEGWKCNNQCSINEGKDKIPYFWPSREINVIKEEADRQIICTFDRENIRIGEGQYNYIDNVKSKDDIDACIEWIKEQEKKL